MILMPLLLVVTDLFIDCELVVLHVGARWDLSFKFVAVQTLTSEAFTLGFDLAHHELNTERLNLVASGLGFVYHY